jgi:hypothetical protein
MSGESKTYTTPDFEFKTGGRVEYVPEFKMRLAGIGAEVTVRHVNTITLGMKAFQEGETKDDHIITLILADTHKGQAMMHLISPEEAKNLAASLWQLADESYRELATARSTRVYGEE